MNQLPAGFEIEPMPARTASGLPAGFELEKPQRNYALSEVPGSALKNAPHSAIETARNLGTAILHPLDTVNAMGDILGGGLRAGVKAVLPTAAFNYIDSFAPPENVKRVSGAANAFGQLMSDRLGGYENIKRTAAEDPVGLLADASMLMTGGGSAAARLPGMAGRLAEGAVAAGNAIDPIMLAGKGAAKAVDFVGNGAANALGLSTGAGADALKVGYQAGKDGNNSFLSGLRGDATADNVVGMAKSGFSDMAFDRGKGYQADIAALGAPTSALDLTPVRTAVSDAKDLFSKNGFIKDDAAKLVHDSIQKKIKEWEKANPTPTTLDFDNLKQAIGVIREGADTGTRAYKVADNVYKSVADEIGGKVSGYKEAMQNYADASQHLTQVSKTMSLNGAGTVIDTAARKLLSGLRNNVNTNFGQRKAILEELNQKNPNLMPTLAGMALSSPTPRGLAGHAASLEAVGALLHNPALLAGLPLTSPKLMGYGAYGAGRAADFAQPLSRFAPSADTLGLLQQVGRVENDPRYPRKQSSGLLGR